MKLRLASFALAAGLAAAQTVGPAGNYSVTMIAANARASGINNYGQIVGSSTDGSAFLWQPITSNATAGSLFDLGGLPAPAPLVNYAAGINDRGQVAGSTFTKNTTNSHAFLWSPSNPNGTSGSMVEFAGDTGPSRLFTAGAINAYGQIFGGGGGTYLWTPATPNGTSGTLNWDNRFQYIYAINDYGQAAINTLVYPVKNMILFTPATPNGSDGSFTQIPGLAGASSHSISAMNRNGAVLGASCFSVDSCLGFLWTPASANGPVGTTTTIPLLPGFTAVTPTALNAAGQAVGFQSTASGAGTAFLYAGGAIYDLSALGLADAMPAAINDRGQIVANANGAAYLLTPAAPSQPAPGESAITINSDPPGRMFTVNGAGCRPGGYTAPQVLGWLPGSVCTVSFISPHSSEAGTRYLFNAWQDGSSFNPRNIVAPSVPATYTGNFTTQFFLNALPNLPGFGSISGGGWYFAGSTVPLVAFPASGYRVVSWTGVSGVPAGAAAVSVNVTSPLTVIANFAPFAPSPPGLYQVSLIANGAAAAFGKPINNFGQVIGSRQPYLAGTSPFLWIPAAPNGTAGNLVDFPSPLSSGAVTAINDRGQVAGSSGGAPILWSPDVPNHSTGAAIAFLGNTGSTSILSMNNFGQIVGRQNFASFASFLWTPSAPNGTSGALDTDGRLDGAALINDYGQVVAASMLFTPSVANGTAGWFTPLPAIGAPVAINSRGAILGTGCLAYGSGCIDSKGYLWTPDSLHGPTGSVVQIPLPAGFRSVRPTALNAKGDVVGILTLNDGAVTPFLYSNGNIYDLAAASNNLTGGIPAGINDAGQIAITTGGLPFNANSAVYLMTPGFPSPSGVTPASGSGTARSMLFQFSDPNGWQDLDVVNILINSSLDGRNACYLAYSRPLNVLYLVNDAGTALLPGLALNGSGSVANSQCSVNGAGSSAAGDGSVLNLTLNLTFTSRMAGNQITYLAARDLAQDNSGWQPLGVWNVPGSSAGSPAVTGLAPAQGSGSSRTFTFTFTDDKGWLDLGVVNVLINHSLDGRQGCYLAYSRFSNTLYLVNDAGTALLPGVSMSGSGAVGNSQCLLNAVGSSVSGSWNTLTLTLNLTFYPSLSGSLVIYAAARDNPDTANSGWQAMGVWSVP